MIRQWLKARKRKQNAHVLYTELVSAAREPIFYTDLNVDDSIDGRFDMIVLHLYALVTHLESLGEPAKPLARQVQEVMVTDMDRNLREMGVGDMSVGKKVKDMGKAWFGRQKAYKDSKDNQTDFMQALKRNLYRDKQVSDTCLMNIANYISAYIAALNDLSLNEIEKGNIDSARTIALHTIGKA